MGRQGNKVDAGHTLGTTPRVNTPSSGPPPWANNRKGLGTKLSQKPQGASKS